MEEKLLTQNELATLLKKSESSIYRWLVEHGLPFLKAGKDVLIRWSDFVTWSERRAQGKDRPSPRKRRRRSSA